MAPLVSILIPAHNAEHWLTDTIQSALGQTWPRMEVIIVDDGSTDRTREIAKGFESKSLKVLAQENRGAAHARNQAFSQCQGEFIQWLDADDLLAPKKIEKQIRCVDGDPNTMALLSGRWGRFYYRPERALFKASLLWRDLAPVDWLVTRFTHALMTADCAWLVSRKLTEQGGLWDERLSLSDDGEYFTRLVTRCQEVKFVHDSACYYRVANAGSLSRRRSQQSFDSYWLSVQLCCDHILKLENTETTRRACSALLQWFIDDLYPDCAELRLHAVRKLETLGSSPRPVAESWRISTLGAIIGRSRARRLKTIIWQAQVKAAGEWDRFLAGWASPRGAASPGEKQ